MAPTPARWQKIEALYHSALERDPAARAAFLDGACGADDELRKEIESLLAEATKGRGLLDKAAAELLAEFGTVELNSGTRLGPYQIEGVIGQGGMGTVYRARDTRLGRIVAIKTSSARFIQRFEREARAIAALNHPHVCHLYHVGPDYLVMEYVEGTPLKGPFPMDQALKYAQQICDALDAAHRGGITHRDLKPGNILISKQGIKLLDFGIARMESGPDDPTMAEMTQSGAVMGTPAYMAPEQWEGKRADARSDIYSFGCVLYEMLTGKRASADRVAVAAALEDILRTCLEKDPDERWQSARDLKHALHWAAEAEAERATAAPHTLAPLKGMGSRFGLAGWIVAGAALAGLATLGAMHFQETPPVLPVVQFSMEAPPDSIFGNEWAGFAPSPDGRYLVFTAKARAASKFSLWLRPLDSIAARPLPDTEGANFPTWSPDSRSLAFWADSKLKRIEISGGAPLTLGDVGADSAVTETGTWNRAGVILFGSAAGLKRVSASGGGATPVTRIDPSKKETGHGYPQFLPDGNRFLYFADSSDQNVRGVYASSLGNPGQRRQILRTAAKAVYVPPRAAYPGYLLWMQNQTLLAQRFDAASLRLEGDPVSVAQEVALNAATPIRAAFWASDAGLLMYFAGPSVFKRPIVWISRDGKQLGDAAPEDTFATLALSPGAERMAVARAVAGSGGQGNYDVWLREFARGVMTRLTFDPAMDRFPVWSPDGKQVTFSSNRDGGVEQIYRKDASGAGQEERLTGGPNGKVALDWSRDGKYLLYREASPETGMDLMALPLEGDRKPIPVVKTQFNEGTGAISPDGRWVAYASNDSGRYELYVQAFPGADAAPKGRWQVSNGGAYDVKWRGDGRELYYESLDGKVMAAAIQAGPQGIRAETPRELFSADFPTGSLHSFDVTADGQRFLLILDSRHEGSTDRLTVISNWQAALRK